MCVTTKYLYLYTEYHSVCPLVGIGTPPTPLPQASVPLHLNERLWGGGGAHTPAGEGLGEAQYRRREKKLSTMPTLCVCDYTEDR